MALGWMVKPDRIDSATQRSLNRFDLNLLRSLDALLSEGNVTNAAKRMNVTQPAMSASLLRLREFFGDQILFKVGREMELTPLAKRLAAPIRTLLANIRNALELEASFDPASAHRHFTISMSDFAACVLMPKLLGRLARSAPHITCRLEPIDNASFDRLASDELQLTITSDYWRGYGHYGPGPEIRSEPLFSDDFVCVACAENPLLGDSLSVDEYMSLGHVVVRLGNDTVTLVEDYWNRSDISIHIVATAPSFASLLAMIVGTPHLATVQSKLLTLLRPTAPIKIFPCPITLPALNEAIVWHSRNEIDPGHKFIREMILEIGSSL